MFEVGDRVRITHKLDPWVTGDTGIIIEVKKGIWPNRIKMDKPYPDEPELTLLASDGELELAKGFDAEPIMLDPSDPFEQVLIKMVETNRRKRSDYAVDGSPWSNFEDVSSGMGIDGFDAVESAEHNVRQKLARLTSLRANGRTQETANESVTDTYLDLAVYAVITFAIHTHPTGKVES